jgi:hypothetical protein
MNDLRALAVLSALGCGASIAVGSEIFPIVFSTMAFFALGLWRQSSSKT